LQFNDSAIQGGGPSALGLAAAGDPFAAQAASFFCFFGGRNGVRKVDQAESTSFMAAYRSRVGVSYHRAALDFNRIVDSVHCCQFLTRRGNTSPRELQLNPEGTVTPIP
jgi:hypothetical protein